MANNLAMRPITNEGYKLLHNGSLCLSQIEHNGMKIDMRYLERTIKKIDKDITHLTSDLKESRSCRKVYKLWRRKYGLKTNIGSRDQLGHILFEELKVKGASTTAKGRWKADKEAIEDIKIPFVKKFIEVEKLKKARSTYLGGIFREVDSHGFLHPCYNLHIPATYRSSVSDPNTQNIPIRDEEVASIIRPCFIPRASNRQIAELDFSGVEVRVSACYNKDPNLLTYIRDETTDMHRDMAMECYRLLIEQMTKDIRYCAKNKFVFPQFYGDWFFSCAQSLWVAIDRMSLKTAQGIPLKKHLREHGIRSLGVLDPKIPPRPGTFIYHLKQVEKRFWEERFPVYAQWKWDWWNAYVKKGYFDTYTGFRCSGLMDKKQASNYPVQGSAFHCLLWCLIKIQKAIKKYKMKTVLIGQIHDSVLSDIAKGELKDYVEIAYNIMTKELRKHWKWIIVPIEADCEVAPVGESWYKKAKLDMGKL